MREIIALADGPINSSTMKALGPSEEEGKNRPSRCARLASIAFALMTL